MMTTDEMKDRYRDLWRRFIQGESRLVLNGKITAPTKELCQEMDALRDGISGGNSDSPDWQKFRETLPGYVEWWNEFDAEMAFQDASRRVASRVVGNVLYTGAMAES